MTSPKEIVFKDTLQTAMFSCGECGTCFPILRDADQAKQRAEDCCGPCACGGPLEKGWSSCEKCLVAASAKRERDKFDKAEKLPVQPEDSPMIYIGDEYYVSWDDYMEGCEKPEDVPEYAYATETVSWKGLDVGDIIESANDDYNVEDQTIEEHLTDYDELRTFIEAWNQKQSIVWYEVDFTRAILRPADYKARFPVEEQAA